MAALLGLMGGGLAHQVGGLEELCLLAGIGANGPGHLGGGPVQPGRAQRCFSLV